MWLEKLGFSGGVFVLGFSVVFVCLILLMGYILVQSLFFGGRNNKAKKQKTDAGKQKAPTNDFIAQVAMDEKKVIAAISAAVAVYLGTSAGNVVIKSYRRIGANTPAWRQAGRRDQIFNKF